MKSFIRSLGCIAVFLAVYAHAETTVNDDNFTALAGQSVAGAEQYALSLRAPKIDDNVFPVPVHYFDDLVNGVKKLKATLNVPLRLSIRNSRKRRLLTVFSLPGDAKIPYGTSLAGIKQVKVSNYKDTASKKVVLNTFVGPNKMIFRTKADAANYNIDFILPITAKHFNQGYVQVAIASSNGEELTEICEVNNANCMQVVRFYVVPRVIEYIYSGSDVSSVTNDVPKAEITVTKSNVDFQFNDNNKRVAFVKRGEIPYKRQLKFALRKYNPNLVIKQKGKVYVSNVDIYPVIYYMSNKKYQFYDAVIGTFSNERPDLHIKIRKTDAALAKKLYNRIGN